MPRHGAEALLSFRDARSQFGRMACQRTGAFFLGFPMSAGGDLEQYCRSGCLVGIGIPSVLSGRGKSAGCDCPRFAPAGRLPYDGGTSPRLGTST